MAIKKKKKKTKTLIPKKNDKLIKAILESPNHKLISVKFEEWAIMFLDKNNPNWGNATKCALKVYKTDKYHSAGAIGHQNLLKLKTIMNTLLDSKKLGVGQLLEIGAAKMMNGSYSDWTDFMERMGYFKKEKENDNPNFFNFDNLNIQILKDRKERGLE